MHFFIELHHLNLQTFIIDEQLGTWIDRGGADSIKTFKCNICFSWISDSNQR